MREKNVEMKLNGMKYLLSCECPCPAVGFEIESGSTMVGFKKNEKLLGGTFFGDGALHCIIMCWLYENNDLDRY